MTKFIFSVLALVCSLSMSAHTIERQGTFDGGKITVTSQEKLFSGCQMRMCRLVKDHKTFYELELDLTDRADHVCEGNLFNIHFSDGSVISLTNLKDTQARVVREEHMETYTHTYTHYAHYYSPWSGCFYSVPVTRCYQEHVPVCTTTTFASLYYVITPQQIDKIINGNVKAVSIVTDNNTIVKKARPLSRAVADLYSIVR